MATSTVVDISPNVAGEEDHEVKLKEEDGQDEITSASIHSKDPSHNTSYSSITKTLSFFRNPFPSTAK